MKKSHFSLLEVLLGLALLLMASGVVSWNLYKAVKKYRFHAAVSKVQTELQLTHQLALNTGVDWTFQLTDDGKNITLHVFSMHKVAFIPKPLRIDRIKLYFQDNPVAKWALYFSPTGCIEPKGRLELRDAGLEFCQDIIIPDCFHKKQLRMEEGPCHPDDLE